MKMTFFLENATIILKYLSIMKALCAAIMIVAVGIAAEFTIDMSSFFSSFVAVRDVLFDSDFRCCLPKLFLICKNKGILFIAKQQQQQQKQQQQQQQQLIRSTLTSFWWAQNRKMSDQLLHITFCCSVSHD